MVRLRHGWGPDDIRDLTGRTAVVTGANSGIGFVTALELAAHGAHTVLACRDAVRAHQAADRIVGSAPRASVEVVVVDLARLASVRQAGARLAGGLGRLDILVNNAGVMGSPFEVTEDGLEQQFATDHLGPFALTGLLLDLLLTTPGSRVVTVSSVAHRLGRLHFPDLQGLEGGYDRWFAYANAKLANLAFAYELDRRLRAAGADALSVAAHPGWARTNLVANGPAAGGSRARRRAAGLAARLGQSVARGALPVLYAATAPGVRGGQFFGPGGPAQQFGPPAPVRSSRRSRRLGDAARLWEASESLTGVRYDFGGVPPAGVTPAARSRSGT